MAAPIVNRGNFTHSYGSAQLPVLKEIFVAAMETYANYREKLGKVVPHDRDIYQGSELWGFNLLPSVAEGSEITFSAANQGASKTLTVAKYARGISWSEEFEEDGKMDWLRPACDGCKNGRAKTRPKNDVERIAEGEKCAAGKISTG